MGMYPSAALSYGVDLGEWSFEEPTEDTESDLPWLTWELWEDSYEIETASATYLKSKGIEGVQVVPYGHPNESRFALITKVIGCSGWGDLTIISTEDMIVTDDATRLGLAWTLLFPDLEPGQIAWRLSASFG